MSEMPLCRYSQQEELEVVPNPAYPYFERCTDITKAECMHEVNKD